MTENLYHRKYRIDSARLSDYDYASNGMYFVIICTHNREPYFGEITPPVETKDVASPPDRMGLADVQKPQHIAALQPNPIGQVAIDC